MTDGLDLLEQTMVRIFTLFLSSSPLSQNVSVELSVDKHVSQSIIPSVELYVDKHVSALYYHSSPKKVMGTYMCVEEHILGSIF